MFEIFNSLEEMTERVIQEDAYAVELPRKLIQRAEKALIGFEMPNMRSGQAGRAEIQHAEKIDSVKLLETAFIESG